MILKRLLTAFSCFLFSLTTFAGHETGGVVITYESVAQVNNNPLEYVLNVYMFFDNFGAPPPASLSVNQSSGCFSSTAHNLSRVPISPGASPLLGSDYCSSGGNIHNMITFVHYRDTVVLPGVCLDYRFFISAGFSRFQNMINITPSFNTHHFEVKLNNTTGPNSTPALPLHEFTQAACLNKPLHLYNFSEKDSDSIYFASGAPTYISGSTVGFFGYSPGYSASNPINSSAGFNVNPQTGQVQTQMTQVGQFLITINYAEYRYVPATQQTVLVGSGQFVITIRGVNACNSAPFDLIHVPVSQPDSLACGDTTIRVATTRKIAAATLTAAGSEFKVLSKKMGILPVSSATVVQDSIVVLHFTQPLPARDTLDVVAQNGTDGNVILSSCGQELLADADTIRFFSPQGGAALASFTHTTNVYAASFNSSTSTGNYFQWNFGDGSPAVTAANPNHTYSLAGVYQVRLIVFSCGQSDTVERTVIVCDSLLPAFRISEIGDTIRLDGSPSSGVSRYSWDFGDGTFAGGMVVNHVYAQSGTYVVRFIASNACGDTVIVTDTIDACNAAIADWTYTVVSTTGSGMLVNFDGSASINAHRYLWDFGDGNTNNTSATPSHTYITPSLGYMVSLTVYNECDEPDVRAFKLNQIGLESIGMATAFNIFPNPASDVLKVEWNPSEPGFNKISVLSLSGKIIIAENTDEQAGPLGKYELDITALPPGIYFVELIGERPVVRSTFVVKQ